MTFVCLFSLIVGCGMLKIGVQKHDSRALLLGIAMTAIGAGGLVVLFMEAT